MVIIIQNHIVQAVAAYNFFFRHCKMKKRQRRALFFERGYFGIEPRAPHRRNDFGAGIPPRVGRTRVGSHPAESKSPRKGGFGAPGGDRTHNLQRRRLTRYPIALRVHILFNFTYYSTSRRKMLYIFARICYNFRKNFLLEVHGGEKDGRCRHERRR